MKKLASVFLLFAVALALSPAPAAAADSNVLIVFDASASMLEKFGASTRVEASKQAVTTFLGSVDPSVKIGLRAYGNNQYPGDKTKACADTTLLQTFTTDHAVISSKTNAIQAVGTYTPTAYALQRAANDFPVDARNTLILLTDGKETCDGNPAAAAAALRAAGIAVTTYVLGLDVDAQTRIELAGVPQAGGGSYFDATDAASLGQNLSAITQKVEEGIDKTTGADSTERGTRIRGGNGFETAVVIAPGVYQLDHHQRKSEFDYFKLPLGDDKFVITVQNPDQKVEYNEKTNTFVASNSIVGITGGLTVANPDRQNVVLITAVGAQAIHNRMIWKDADLLRYADPDGKNSNYRKNTTGPIEFAYLKIGLIGLPQHKDTVITIEKVATPAPDSTPTPTSTAPEIAQPDTNTTAAAPQASPTAQPASSTTANLPGWLWIAIAAAVVVVIVISLLVGRASKK